MSYLVFCILFMHLFYRILTEEKKNSSQISFINNITGLYNYFSILYKPSMKAWLYLNTQ